MKKTPLLGVAALVLLAGAGFAANSFWRSDSITPGGDPRALGCNEDRDCRLSGCCHHGDPVLKTKYQDGAECAAVDCATPLFSAVCEDSRCVKRPTQAP